MVVVIFFQVFLGCSIVDLSAIVQGNYRGSTIYKSIIVFGIILTVVILVVLVVLTKHELKKMEQIEEDEKKEEDNERASLLIPNWFV